MNLKKYYSKMSKFSYYHPRIYSFLRTVFEGALRIRSLHYYVFRIFPINKKKIVMDNYNGEGYADNPKLIADYLLKNHKDYTIIWLLDKKTDSELPSQIIPVKAGSLRAYYHLSTAKIWIDNVRKLSDTRKRKGQYYIQTWHGYGPKAYWDQKGLVTKAKIKALQHDSDITDLFVSNNKHLTEMYHTDFMYSGEVIDCGFPRNDIFFRDDCNEIIKKIYDKYSIKAGAKILLYAPTYRADFNTSSFNLEYDKILQSLSKRFGGDWVLFIRLHLSNAAQAQDYMNKQTNFINVMPHLDMQELLLASDVLISDYSSCMFDFAVSRKPCFLYHPDAKEYDDTRGFCIQPEDLPFPRAHSTEEMQQIIESFSHEEYLQTLEEYFNKVSFHENGTACKAVVDWFEEKIHHS